MTEKIVFNLTLRAEAELAVSPMDSFLTKGERIQRLPRIRKVERAPVYLPSGTLRHMLRHHAFLCLGDAGLRYSLRSALMLAKGYVGLPEKGQEKESSRSGTRKGWELEQGIRRANPLLDMFGAGLVFSGTISVGHAWPPPEDNPGKCLGVFGEGCRMPLDSEEVSVLSDPTEYFDFVDGLKKVSTKKKEKNPKNKTKEETSSGDQETGLEEASGSQEEENSSLQLQMPIGGYEAIVPGTELSWRIAISRTTPVKTGFVLAALRRISENPVLGAHNASGAGLFSLSGSAIRARETIGTIRLSEGEFFVDGWLDGLLSEWDKRKDEGFPGLDFSCVDSLEKKVDESA